MTIDTKIKICYCCINEKIKGEIGLNTTLNKETIKTFLKICQKEIAKGNCHLINRNLDINGKIINTKQVLKMYMHVEM